MKRIRARAGCDSNPRFGSPEWSHLVALTFGAVEILMVLAFAAMTPSAGAGEPFAVPLPAGVRAVWALGQADREATPTRERVCLNGLWRWQPAGPDAAVVPAGDWGYFKVPGSWPGITDYMQKDSQTVFVHPRWQDRRLRDLAAAWYEREIRVPEQWAGRKLTLRLEYLNSYAAVYVDGMRAGETVFPGGEVDLTTALRPGAVHRLSLRVLALPLKGVMLAHTDSASAREVAGSVARRGLCGDVYLVSAPAGPRIVDVRVEPSVRRRQLTIDVAIENLVENGRYTLRGRVREVDGPAREFRGPSFAAEDLDAGRIGLTEDWMPDRLWDIHTPQNRCRLEVTLLSEDGEVLDAAWTVDFGFREFTIEGRDFHLNGTRLFLSVVPLDNAQVGAALANYAAARESLRRLRKFGINFVYTHNYGCEPGSHLSFAEILRAADDTGMLVGFSQPHFSHYDWQGPDADRDNGYARHAEFYVRAARNHPAVVMYAMSHNATGYSDDMNLDMIDGLQDARDNWALRNAKQARRAEAIVRRLDPGRIVYHHASGNLGAMHPINFYPNFAPIQELSDWFEHWATRGVKPVFLCEYGAPFSWDWTMYRGWYQGEREFGSARVPWEFCLAEWNAQFLGDRAYPASEAEQANLRWEARQLRAGRVWHRWDYPHAVGSTVFDERYPVFAAYITDNWRAFRTWGVSAVTPWDHGHFWKLREGVNRGRQTLPVDWDALQRPGFSPDYLDRQYERVDLAYAESDWAPTPAAQALLRNNAPVLAYLAGKPAAFTGKDHNFLPGEAVEKQIIVLNNSRVPVTADAEWSFGPSPAVSGRVGVTVATGDQERIPLRVDLPPATPPGHYELRGRVRFDDGHTQDDVIAIRVLPPPDVLSLDARIALFDPKGQTGPWLERMGVRADPVDAGASLEGYDLLIVGQAALEPSRPAPDIRAVRDGLKVVLFAQTSETLEKRLGFRVAEYGLRQVFPRVPDHPVVAGLDADHLRDWRGEARVLPPRLEVQMRPRHGPTVQWCGIPVTRLWRCGNRGNVASVLIEKPARGDFLPIMDGGYGLQYSPLLEYREGRGLMLFCQMDVIARTEPDPAAEILGRNILQYAVAWQPEPRRTALYAGDAAGRSHLEAAGIAVGSHPGGSLSPDQVLVLGPGGAPDLAGHAGAVTAWLEAGGRLLTVGLDRDAANRLPFLSVKLKEAEHISTSFAPFPAGSFLAGIGPADVHNRDPRKLPLVVGGARLSGNGVLATAAEDNVVFCQLVPWEFDARAAMNLKRTFRRASFTLSRLLANLGVAGSTPLLERFRIPAGAADRRWLNGFYLDIPEEWDDPYRFFRW